MKGFTRSAVWGTGILGAIGLLLYLFVLDVWVVPRGADAQFAASILPALMPDDKLLVQRGRAPKWGELVRCASPEAPGSHVVGRVFGMPGDRVEVSDHGVFTNGSALPARHGCAQRMVAHPVTGNLVTMSCGVSETGAWSFEYLTTPEMNAGTHTAIVEAGKAYLVSDNRLMHQDSRDFGQVDASTCEHVVFRLWGERYSDGSRRFQILW
ncbi:MAG: signal peptidase I [Labilithrix sp.]|nr:signal peptidase I [Labilithrix sp.]MBX3217451.1 signal peptidase I [Labilithrix sp.]